MADSSTDASAMAAPIPQMEYTRDGFKVKHMDTAEVYDRWAEVLKTPLPQFPKMNHTLNTLQIYDTDGNFLQALDTIEMKTLLPYLMSQIKPSTSPLKVVDLGCGTGRNTVQLIHYLLDESGPRNKRDSSVIGFDVSRGMLDIARARIDEILPPNSTSGIKTHVDTYNLLTEPTPPLPSQNATAIISTLVLEHIPLKPFFSTAAAMLNPDQDGYLLITNMHPEMGAISQAGFIDPVSGEKIRPTSYAHKVQEVVDAAREAGFEVLGEGMRETKVDEELAPKLGPRVGKYVGVTVWFGGCFVRRGKGSS